MNLFKVEGGPHDGLELEVSDGYEKLVIPGEPKYIAEYEGEPRLYHTQYIYTVDRQNNKLVFLKKDQPSKVGPEIETKARFME